MSWTLNEGENTLSEGICNPYALFSRRRFKRSSSESEARTVKLTSTNASATRGLTSTRYAF
jgi:hypothetical protein